MHDFGTCQWLLYPERYQILRLNEGFADARPHVELQQFISVTYGPEATTMICVEGADMPNAQVLSNGWRVLQIKGPYEEQNIQLVQEITRILREAKIEILSTAAFETDYVLLKHDRIADALDVLEQAEYRIDQRKLVAG